MTVEPGEEFSAISYPQRNEEDQRAPLGIATTRYEERALAAAGVLEQAPPVFESQQEVIQGGVLFALPALLSQGLMDYSEVYEPLPKGYYSFDSIVLTLAIMALCRIKNPEQLKQCKVGELGRVIGLDRVPEAKCLREKLKQIVDQNQAENFNRHLMERWISKEQCVYFYVDGHVRIYYGDQAQLTSKYVSRQKLCLSATTEYWVNDSQGLPYLVVTGELSERLQQVIEKEIIPRLLQNQFIQTRKQGNEPILFTLVFDREAYEPTFFNRLWEDYRIAVITYRKNVKDLWEEKLFKPFEIQILENKVDMLLYEQEVILNNLPFREVRCLTETGHQTAIITTHPGISIQEIASKMFSRWSQENFFRYMIADYDFDKMVQFGVETIDENKLIVNPEYRQLTHRIKKQREKIQRLEAKFYPMIEKINDQNIDQLPSFTAKQAEYKIAVEELKKQLLQLKQNRTDTAAKITLKQMPENKRYNKLKTESKLFMNIIKMICYRAESALAALVNPIYVKGKNEKRMLIKQIFNTAADLIPDYENHILTVQLYSLSRPRDNKAVIQLCELLNQSETIFPGTNLKLIFKTTAS